jgi:hypothetical protein
VILVARHEEIVVGAHVYGADAVAREFRRQRLRWNDPDVSRRAHEEILDPPIAREDPEAADQASV